MIVVFPPDRDGTLLIRIASNPPSLSPLSQWSSEHNPFPVKKMHTAGTLRFLDIRKHGVLDAVDHSHRPPSKARLLKNGTTKTNHSPVVNEVLKPNATKSETLSHSAPRSISTPDVAPEATTRSGRHTGATPSSTTPNDEANAFEDAAQIDDDDDDDFSGNISSDDDDTDVSAPSKLRRWSDTLRSYQITFKEDSVNDAKAAKRATQFLTKHLKRADKVVEELVARRDKIAAEANGFDAGHDNGGSAPYSRTSNSKSRALRRLQLFDAEAFAALSNVAEAQTRRFFEPLRDVSSAMFARFLKAKFSGPGCSDDRIVDWESLGRQGSYLEGKQAGFSKGFGTSICVDAIGNSVAQALGFPTGQSGSKTDKPSKNKSVKTENHFYETGGVFRRDGAGENSNTWHEFGVARRSRRAAPCGGAKGPVSRPDVDHGIDAYGTHTNSEENKKARTRAQRLSQTLQKTKGGTLGFMKDIVFDAHSFARTVEHAFDVSSLIAGGEASMVVDEEGDTIKDIKVKHATPCVHKNNGNKIIDLESDESRDKNQAFVLRLDLATWRLLGAVGGVEGMDDDDKVKREDSDDEFGFANGFENEDDGAYGDYGGNTVNVLDHPKLQDDGVRMRGIMPLGADPFEALLDDDFDAARRAHASLNLAPREGAIVAGMAYVYREGFMDETFFRNWASDMLVTFFHFSKAAAKGGPAHALATRAVLRVAKHWLENNPTMPVGSTSEDVLFFNEGCYVLRELGVPHERLRQQLDAHLVRFESKEYFRGLDLSKPETYRVAREKWDTGRDTTDKAKDTNSHENTEFEKTDRSPTLNTHTGPQRLLTAGDGDVKKFNTALIWSYFFSESGAEENADWVGDTAHDIRHAAEVEVDLESILALHVDDQRSAPDFDDVCYFVTHKIFVATQWGLKRLRPEEWKYERQFLRTHLKHAMHGAKHGYGDVHLVGEFVQCLRCFDDVARNDSDVGDATRWTLSRQNKKTGGWEVLDHDFKNSYHATICALGALLTPTMVGVAEKVSLPGGGARGGVVRGGRGKGDAGQSIAQKNPEISTRRSTRGVAKLSLTEHEQKERRAAWDKARARPWDTAAKRNGHTNPNSGAKRQRRPLS